MRPARFISLSVALGTLFAVGALAAQTVPAGTTGICGDGTYTSAKTKSGACSSHGGVKTWLGTPAAAPAPTPKPAAPPPPPTRTAAAGRPAGATGQCGDGSYTTAKSKSGACSSHGGVKEWFAAAAAAPPPPPPAPRNAPAPKNAPPSASTTEPKVAPIPGAPAAATALCNDGTYSESQHRSGTCSSHKGVKQWLKNIPPQ